MSLGGNFVNINTLKFKFIAFNIFIIVLLFFLFISFATTFTRRFIVRERIESRTVVNEQAAFTAIPIVMGGLEGLEGLFDEFLSAYPDLVYSVAISLPSKIDFYTDYKDKLWFIKNENLAREFEDLFSQRPEKTEVFERNKIINIISPVQGIDNEGKERILGYVLSGFTLETLMGKLHRVNWLVTLVIILTLGLVTFIAYIMTSIITKPLNKAVDVINNVASGDFTSTVSIKSKSEIGKLISTINKMISTWRSSIEKMKEVIDCTNTSAESMSSAAKQQESSTSEQASAINEVTTTVDELNSSSKQMYGEAEQMSESSQDVLKIASEGQKAINESIEEINTIREKVKTISEHTLNLSVEAQQIGSIVKTVSDIANKTDMLAINAGIEAARAGEHGKGFSIVATEVRELADQSQKSAKKIAVLIENIQSATNSTVLSTEEAIKGFQVGIKLILEAGKTIDNLIKHTQETVNYASKIALASRQQSLGTEHVASAMTSINEGMRATAVSAVQILEEANNLRKLSNDLSIVANTYKI